MSDDKQINITPKGDILEFRTGEAKQLYQYDGYQYTAESTESLITLVRSKGSEENTIIAYTDGGIKVILDDTVITRDQDRLKYNYKYSQQFEEFRSILEKGVVFEQKQFIDFLRRREPGEINGQDMLMAAIQSFKFSSIISGDFTYDDQDNYICSFKIGDAEGTVKIPQLITANIEVFNESDFVQTVELELEIKKPRDQSEKPLIALTCPKLPRYLQKAMDHEIETVENELEGYLIVAGVI